MNQPVNTTPPQQTNPQTQIAQNVPARSKKKMVFWIIALVSAIVLVPVLVIAIMVSVSLNSARQKASEAQLKSAMGNIRVMAEDYFQKNNTYEGFIVSSEYQGLANKMGTNYNFKTNNGTSFIIYAKVPKKEAFICADNQGQIKETTSIQDIETCN
jgi:Tfp pilus assembly protein PilE